MLQVRNSELLIYDEWRGVRYPGNISRIADNKTYSGEMTGGSIKRLRRSVSLLVQLSPKRKIWNPVSSNYHDFSLSFVTLTCTDPGKDTAKDTYQKCLAKFLRWGRSKGIEKYVWKAELQERGAIHYHVATNVFLHYQEVKDKWNQFQKQAGYLQNFGAKHGHFRPNSTDIHAVYKVKDMEKYLSKYMAKPTGAAAGQKLQGKVWDASTTLKKSPYFSTELTPFNLDQARYIGTKEIRTDFSTIIRIPTGHARFVLDPLQRLEYNNFLTNL